MSQLIRESKKWKNLNVPLAKDFPENEIINKNPIESKISDVIIKYNNFDQDELLDFIRNHNITASGNTNFLPKELFKNIKNSCFATFAIDNKLISFGLSTIVPIKVKEDHKIDFVHKDFAHLNSNNTILFGYTNYLCTHKDFRSTGKGIGTVEAILNYGISRGVICGYFISPSPRTANYIELNNWMRPLNFTAAKKIGFTFKSFRMPKDKSELRNELYYKINLPTEFVQKDAHLGHLNDYIRLIKDTTFAFYPNKSAWEQWLNVFKTYVIYENNKVISVGSLLITETFMSKTKKVAKIANIVFIVGDPVILNFLFNVANDLGAHIVLGYQIGDLDDETLESLKCSSGGKMYLEFYNTSLKHKVENICVPIF